MKVVVADMQLPQEQNLYALNLFHCFRQRAQGNISHCVYSGIRTGNCIVLDLEIIGKVS